MIKYCSHGGPLEHCRGSGSLFTYGCRVMRVASAGNRAELFRASKGTGSLFTYGSARHDTARNNAGRAGMARTLEQGLMIGHIGRHGTTSLGVLRRARHERGTAAHRRHGGTHGGNSPRGGRERNGTLLVVVSAALVCGCRPYPLWPPRDATCSTATLIA